MNISLLSGAIKNSGDYLIQNRTIALLKEQFPDCSITIYNRLNSIDPYIDKINTSDCIVLAGGPLVMTDTYPNKLPLTTELGSIKIPIYTVGIGWYGKNDLPQTLYENYLLNDSTKKLFKKIESFAPISCRDWYTANVLKNNGINNTVMTGCPALYDICELKNNKEKIYGQIKKICVSDPGYSINSEKCCKLLEYLKGKYSNADIHLVFHRGIESDKYTSEKKALSNSIIVSKANELGIVIHDISYSSEGFKIYDDCDLHIGFRVHAHIYNLSQKNISILIEEDGRGIGIDHALNLHGIRPYNFEYDAINSTVLLNENKYFIKDLEIILEEYSSSCYAPIKYVIQTIKQYYNVMSKHIYLFNE